MYKTAGHAFTDLLLKESVANDVKNVSLFAGPVCCEPCHQRVEAVPVGRIATLKITMSKRNGSTVNLITGDDFFYSLLL